jgi:hypothetical protein
MKFDLYRPNLGFYGLQNRGFRVKIGSKLSFWYTVKPVYNDHTWDQEKVVVIKRWSLFRGSTCPEQNLIKNFIKKNRGWSLNSNCREAKF